eukprot:scaffold5608_cov17-Tisochrysis_lutea.AAC.3
MGSKCLQRTKALHWQLRSRPDSEETNIFLTASTRSEVRMTSCVASALAAHAPCPSPSEVEAVFHAPLSLFVDGGASHTYQDITWEQHAYRIHSFDHAGFKIWGLTAGILIQVQSWGSWEGTKHKFGCNLGMRGEGSKRLHTGAMLR